MGAAAEALPLPLAVPPGAEAVCSKLREPPLPPMPALPVALLHAQGEGLALADAECVE